MVPETIDVLAALLQGRRVVALTGAGISTESGIPDYRGPKTRHKTRNPIQYRDFVGSPAAQARYWARSVIGWPRMATAAPNPAHRALAALERTGQLAGVITQNVDRLHARAGSRRVVELHGALAEVRCLSCGLIEDRDALQARMLAANPGWSAHGSAEQAPDGDAELSQAVIDGFEAVGCVSCAGVLKPDVVFFGENVSRPVTAAAWRLYEEAEVLLVVGSSLTVFSGYRFVRRAAQEGRPVALVNLGPTRGDHAAAVRVDAPAGVVLPQLAARLAQGR